MEQGQSCPEAAHTAGLAGTVAMGLHPRLMSAEATAQRNGRFTGGHSRWRQSWDTICLLSPLSSGPPEGLQGVPSSAIQLLSPASTRVLECQQQGPR